MKKNIKENCYFCNTCGKYSIATKPTKYINCPCGGSVILIDQLIDQAIKQRDEEWIRNIKEMIANILKDFNNDDCIEIKLISNNYLDDLINSMK